MESLAIVTLLISIIFTPLATLRRVLLVFLILELFRETVARLAGNPLPS